MKEIKQITLHHQHRDFHIEFFERKGKGAMVLFLHGLGGAKENFDWATKHPDLLDCHIVAFDNPGTGNSSYHLENRLNIDDLVEITHLFIQELVHGSFYLVGASMGGLTLSKYIEKYAPKNILGLISIEGNLMAEDCMFSGKVTRYDYSTFLDEGYQKGIGTMKENQTCGYQTIAHNLEINTDPTAYYDYSFQTVEYSKTGELFEAFIQFDYPKLFLHGDANNSLSYLPQLRQSDVLVREISQSDHFLFYDNPKELYQVIAEFINQVNYNDMIVKKENAVLRQFKGVNFEVLAVGQQSMVTKMLYKKENSVPMHHHPNEQSGYVISGRYRLKFDNKDIILESGDSYSIPENVEHSIQVIEEGEVIDVFTPPREDYF